MNTTRLFAFIGLGLLAAASLCAQPPRGDGRGGDGRGGGFRGGGPPGGGFGDRGGFRGGPPGGGFGDRGGSRGGPSPFGGGPADFLGRLDQNGNGMIDVEEQTGPAQFLIPRLASVDPEIKAGQPIPIKRITKAFEKMRQQREGGGDRGSNDAAVSSARDEALLPELLVPGFGSEEELEPLMGFGPTAEMLLVKVTPEDEREAAERMRRYDRNGDGVLTKDELSSRFSGNPMDFDRNRDGKLSVNELAVRYARRREGEEEARSQSREEDRRRDTRRDAPELPDVYNGRKSYRIQSIKKLPEGLPGFFTDKDANQDGQVTMAEFASEWSDELVTEFFQSDLNRDGVITAFEAQRAVEQGVSTPSPSSVSQSTPRPPTAPSSSGSPSSKPKDMAAIRSVDGKPDPKLVTYAERIVSRYDKNKDKALTASEWKSMLMNPAPADGNRDGRITIDEYARWMQSRSKR